MIALTPMPKSKPMPAPIAVVLLALDFLVSVPVQIVQKRFAARPRFADRGGLRNGKGVRLLYLGGLNVPRADFCGDPALTPWTNDAPGGPGGGCPPCGGRVDGESTRLHHR